jgi:DNA-3-methyladenine glycosylase
LAGIITETEAYLGVKDKACHAYNSRRTERVRSLYLAGGHVYIYFIYGRYFCLNVVTRPAGDPQAVLIRGVLPLLGEETMRKNRRAREHLSVADGPGKLCQAFGLTREHDGLDLLTSGLRISELSPEPRFLIRKTPRIGVDYAGEWAAKKLRYLAVSV